MPEPFHGLVVIAEYGSKVEVDLAVAALADAGIRATASFDPAMNTAAPFLASDRTFELLVREPDAESAVARLEALDDTLPDEFRPTGPRPRGRGRARARRVILVGLVIWLLGPALVIAVGSLLFR